MDKVEHLAKIINEYQLSEIEYQDKEISVTLKKDFRSKRDLLNNEGISFENSCSLNRNFDESNTLNTLNTATSTTASTTTIPNVEKSLLLDTTRKKIEENKKGLNENSITIESTINRHNVVNEVNEANGINGAYGANETNSKISYIRSPLAGVFYSRSDPKAKPFIKIGDKVLKGKVICIVETMKIMNEIEAEGNFKLLKVLKNDGEIVEFDEIIFEVEYE